MPLPARIVSAACLTVVSAACTPLPDTVGEAAPSGMVWRLDEVNDAPATYPATLRLLDDGRVIGAAPCGRFQARQEAPLPWVEITDITPSATRCARAQDQQAFFLVLEAMDFAEISGANLLLSNDSGQSLYFRAAQEADS